MSKTAAIYLKAYFDSMLLRIGTNNPQFTFSPYRILNFKRITYIYDYKGNTIIIDVYALYLKVDVHVPIYHGNIIYIYIIYMYTRNVILFHLYDPTSLII